MKARAFTLLSPPQLPSNGKLLLQLCLQELASGLFRVKSLRAVRFAMDWALFGSACVLATALPMRFNQGGGQYFPL